MRYEITIRRKSSEFLNKLDDKSRRIVRARLATLQEDPFPGKGGDKELIKAPKGRPEEKVYRLHIGRSFISILLDQSRNCICHGSADDRGCP